MANPIDVSCPYCHVPSGRGCHKWNGEPTLTEHTSRHVLASVVTEHEGRAAEAIAQWLLREYVTIGSDVAEAIRAGKWRTPPNSDGKAAP